MFFSLFLDYWSILFLTLAVITHIFNLTAEFAISTRITMTEVKPEIEKQPVKVEAKISKCSINPEFY